MFLSRTTGSPKKLLQSLASALVVVLLLGLSLSDPPTATAAGGSGKENVVFYYQKVANDPGALEKFKGASAVVVSNQGSAEGERDAVQTIHAAGARALHYVNFYWYPESTLYQDMRISDRKGWIFCEGKRKRKVVGKTVGGVRWYFLDANERGARNYIIRYLRKLKDYGYDGVFFDRGSSSLLGTKDGGGYIAWKKSTCTAEKVIKGKRRTFADVFVSLLKDARRKVFGDRAPIFMNYGGAPYRPPKLRPDPRDRDCRARRWKRCSSLGDAWKWLSRAIDEAPSHPFAHKFLEDYRDNQSSENHYGRVIGEIRMTSADRDETYFRWARARLFRLSLFVNTGDDLCPTAPPGEPCYRWGTYPELTKVNLGLPVDRKPQSISRPGTRCGSDDPKIANCLWIRRYARGMVAVNVTNTTVVLDQNIGLGASRSVKDVFTEALVNPCGNKVTQALGPWTGRVYVYGSCISP